MHRDAGVVPCARHRNRRREEPHQGNNKPRAGTPGGEEQDHRALMKGKVRQHREISSTTWTIIAAEEVEYLQHAPCCALCFISTQCSVADQKPEPRPILGVALHTEQTLTFFFFFLKGSYKVKKSLPCSLERGFLFGSAPNYSQGSVPR